MKSEIDKSFDGSVIDKEALLKDPKKTRSWLLSSPKTDKR